MTRVEEERLERGVRALEKIAETLTTYTAPFVPREESEWHPGGPGLLENLAGLETHGKQEREHGACGWVFAAPSGTHLTCGRPHGHTGEHRVR